MSYLDFQLWNWLLSDEMILYIENERSTSIKVIGAYKLFCLNQTHDNQYLMKNQTGWYHTVMSCNCFQSLFFERIQFNLQLHISILLLLAFITLRVFATITKSFHLSWSCTITLEFRAPRSSESFSTTLIPLFRGQPHGIFLSSFQSNTTLVAALVLRLITWQLYPLAFYESIYCYNF